MSYAYSWDCACVFPINFGFRDWKRRNNFARFTFWVYLIRKWCIRSVSEFECNCNVTILIWRASSLWILQISLFTSQMWSSRKFTCKTRWLSINSMRTLHSAGTTSACHALLWVLIIFKVAELFKISGRWNFLFLPAV